MSLLQKAQIIGFFSLIYLVFNLSCNKDENNPVQPVEKKGSFSLNVNSIDFTANQNDSLPSKFVFVISPSTSSLEWTISVDKEWLNVNPQQGKGVGAITVSINTSGIDTGKHNANIIINSKDANNSPQNISINYYIKSTTIFWEKLSTPFEKYRINCFFSEANGNILAGIDTLALFRSSDQGTTWSQLGLRNNGVKCIASNSNEYIFIGTHNKGIFRSTNNGTTWTTSNSGIIIPSYEYSFRSIESIISLPSGTLLCGLNNLYSSNNHGESWNRITTAPGISYNSFKLIFTTQSSKIFICLVKGVYFSNDLGDSWENINFDFPVISYSINQKGHIFFGTLRNGIFRSIDEGITWTQLGLYDIEIAALTIDPEGKIFAGTTKGVFISKDNGDIWNDMSRGLDYNQVSSLIINSKGFLLAGTGYGIIYKTLKPTSLFR